LMSISSILPRSPPQSALHVWESLSIAND
jgi:hypothetical protein